MAELTDMQQRFVDHHLATGCTPTEAARVVGFGAPKQAAHRLTRKPHVAAAILAGYGDKVGPEVSARRATRQVTLETAKQAHERRAEFINGPLADLALAAIEEIVKGGPGIPASARKGAAEWVLGAAGHSGKAPQAGDDVPLHEMTSAQLEAFITKAQATIEAGGAPPIIAVIDGQITQSAPSN